MIEKLTWLGNEYNDKDYRESDRELMKKLNEVIDEVNALRELTGYSEDYAKKAQPQEKESCLSCEHEVDTSWNRLTMEPRAYVSGLRLCKKCHTWFVSQDQPQTCACGCHKGIPTGISHQICPHCAPIFPEGTTKSDHQRLIDQVKAMKKIEDYPFDDDTVGTIRYSQGIGYNAAIADVLKLLESSD